ncbi:hypothetical protein QMZ20_11635, partial [Serratia bockelmannii]|nr:hypothetical protein [Serratia bockelmannii]
MQLYEKNSASVNLYCFSLGEHDDCNAKTSGRITRWLCLLARRGGAHSVGHAGVCICNATGREK